VCAAALALVVAACAGGPAGRPAPLSAEASAPRAGDTREEAREVEPASELLASQWIADLPFVEATIDGGGPFLLLLDSGMSVLALAPRVVEEIGLERVPLTADGSPVALDAVSGDAYVDQGARISELHLGTYVVRDTGALIFDMEPFDQLLGVRIDGILPVSGFRDRLVTIDPEREIVALSRGELPAADGRDVLELIEGADRPYVLIEIGGRLCPTLIDTGFGGYLHVPAEREDSLRFRSPLVVAGRNSTAAGIYERREGRLDGAIMWGRHRISDPVVSISPAPYAVAGALLLGEFRTTFDIGHSRVRFERGGEEPLMSESVRSPGFGYLRDGDGWTVAYVLGGTPAARAGVRVGDRIDRVAGLAVGELTRAAFGRLIRSLDTLHLEVSGPDGPRTVSVDMATIVK
jgi:predicted aspartyl protease